jgi:hypothetical protein
MGVRKVLLLIFVVLTIFAVPGLAAEATPDVEVTYIERNPKYERYWVNYSGATEYSDDFVPYEVDSAISLANPGAKRWPDLDEPVTFTAHLLNRGSTSVSSFDFVWKIDGVIVNSGTYSGTFTPGDTMTFNLGWLWQSDRHTVTFEVILADDATPANNILTDYTDGLTFFTLIEESYDQAFVANTASVPSPATTYATEWLQNHVKKMNQMFEDAGASTRVRYDKLELIPDDSAPNGCWPNCSQYDGSFPQVFLAGEKDLRLGGSAWYEADEDIDYALLHELSHQLGLIDLYRMNMNPGQNKVNGLPYSAMNGLMNSGSHFVSSHTAGALNAWHGYRRGYFGQYLFDIPTTNTIYVEDVCENPLSGAGVKVYQKIQRMDGVEEMPNVVKFLGTTDSLGLYELPNVAVDTTNFPPTNTDNSLKPNPFGYISNHGENGLFMLELWNTQEKEYQFLDITAFNLAYWLGNTANATYPFKTQLVSNPVPGNTAESKSASADITEYISGWCGMSPPSVPSNANDGDLSTSWCRDSTAVGDYWQVDLGKVTYPYKVVLYTHSRKLRAEGSLSGEFSGEQSLLFRMDTESSDEFEAKTHIFPPQGLRYLRFTIEEDQDWVRLREVEVYTAEESCRTYGLSLQPVIDSKSGSPNSEVAYALKVTNEGSGEDTYDVAASGNVWPTSVPPAIGPLAAGGSETLDVTVSIPGSAVDGATDTVEVTLTSQTNPTKMVTAKLVTTASPYKLFAPIVTDQT